MPLVSLTFFILLPVLIRISMYQNSRNVDYNSKTISNIRYYSYFHIANFNVEVAVEA